MNRYSVMGGGLARPKRASRPHRDQTAGSPAPERPAPHFGSQFAISIKRCEAMREIHLLSRADSQFMNKLLTRRLLEPASRPPLTWYFAGNPGATRPLFAV